jgi:hypothetical protein
MMDSTSTSMETEVTKVIDSALERLRWCREHAQERGASEALREVEARLGYLAQALSWEMDGESARAAIALRMSQGRSRRVPPMFFDPHDPNAWEWWTLGH